MTATQPEITATPYVWKDPASLPRRGHPEGEYFEDVDPALMEIVWEAVAAHDAAHAVPPEEPEDQPEEPDVPPEEPKAQTEEPKAANDNKQQRKIYNTIDAEALLALEFEPIRYVVPGYVAEGLTLLGGRPKLGKSWLALDFGIAVATGGQSLGVQCQAGDALYLALEDNQRRLQDRLRVVLPASGRPDLSRLSLLTEAPKIVPAWSNCSTNGAAWFPRLGS